MAKVLTVGCSSYYSPHKSFGKMVMDVELLKSKHSGIDLVVFVGGADIDPAFYKHEKHPLTGCSPSCDIRDRYAFSLAQRAGIPCAGICRGGQFLIAMAGGFLVQHVAGHTSSHNMTTFDGQIMKVSSCHHQMFGCPLPKDSQLLGWSTEKYAKKAFESMKLYTNKYSRYFSRVDVEHPYEPGIDEMGYEPEMVYLPNINSLATQYHPEMMLESSPGHDFYVKMVEKLLNKETFSAAAEV